MDKNSREYMLWCEADMICNMRKLSERREYLERIEKRRGKKAADGLRAKVQERWKKRAQGFGLEKG